MSDHGFMLSRRRFLVWAGAGAAAGAGGLAGFSSRHEESAMAAVDALLSAPFRGPQREIRTLHFALGKADQFHTNLRLCVGGTMVPLVRHDDRSRGRLAIQNPVAARTDLSQFTHAAAHINVPATRPLEVNVWGVDRETGEDVLVGGVVLCPTWSTRRIAQAAQQLGVLHSRYAEDALVRALGIAPDDAPSTPREAVALADLADIATTSAQKFVFKYPSILNMDAATSSVTNQIITGTAVIDGLSKAMSTFLDNVGVYGLQAPMVNATGQQQTLPSGPNGTNPQPGFSFQPFVTDHTKYKGVELNIDWTSALRQNAAQTVTAVVNLVQDTLELENKSWVLATGTPPATKPVNSPEPPAARPAAVGRDPQDPAATTTTTTLPPGPPPDFSIDNNWTSGTKLELEGLSVQSGIAVITVRVFNNNEKAYDVYAQYYNADGVQVNAAGDPYDPKVDPSPDLAVNLGPTLFACPTIVGIPIFDTNYIDYQVPIPTSVTTTNIFLASMGGKSGWQQYLKDSSGNQLYGGLVFPDECKLAVIWTTVMNLALPAMLLALDVISFASMLSTAFTAAGNVSRAALQEDVAAFFSGIKALFPALGALVDAISGFATTADYNTPDKPSLVTVLVDTGLVLIGLLAIPALVRILAAIYAGAATEEPIKAIPIIGEVFAAISAAANLAVLGQTCGEVANDTWVRVSALTGTHDTVVTVNPEGVAFPPSATYWELIPELGMTDALTATTDSNFQADGPQVGPLIIPLKSLPFGNTITYTIHFREGGPHGWIVGSGATEPLSNSDPSNLPEPTINISNVAPPVSTGSTFDRKFSSQFDTTASAYSWSVAATIPGTIADQQTCDSPQTVCQAGSIAVGALTGFVGYTYQSEQGWFVRQVGFPDAPSGAKSIATPFASEPLLLYDSIGLNAESGQNFLLDPIEGVSAYHVRQLNLTTDSLGFDRATSWGVFRDTIHAVVVHPAGFLIGLNTDNAILHILQLPDAGMDELLAPTATMHAGKGNASGLRPGLMQNPVSVAVALNGMVLALEQGANRIQAFDVRGNPTQYFTANGVANSSYYLPLVSQDTYLGMSIDGAGFIYTLSYSGDGSDLSQYGIDIYHATGEHIARSSGVNAATFVVDPWRNVYTQNFAAVQDSSGGVHLTPQGVAEPSASVWALNTPHTPGNG